MSDSILPPEILGLPVASRLVIVEQLWDSIADDSDAVALTDFQKAELERRLELRKTDPGRNSPWAVVKERLNNSL
jgi:putative addiction module component (TIGR02574 family)